MTDSPRVCAVVLAGGEGRRAGLAKQFAQVGGHTLLYHACVSFLTVDAVGALVAVVSPEHRGEVERELAPAIEGRSLTVVPGGATRHESSRRGLAAVAEGFDLVLIHDAARPFASAALIRRVIAAAARHGAAVPALRVQDATVETGDQGATVERGEGEPLRRYLPRQRLRAVQTPQGFRLELLRRAFEGAAIEDYADDGQVALAAGMEVMVIEGEEDNRKITSRRELEEALRRLKENTE